MEKNRNIYVVILHEYFTPQHFKALYEAGKEFGIIVEDYIVLSNRKIIKEMLESIKAKKGIFCAVSTACFRFLHKIKLFTLKNKTLIVGIAPYNYLLNRYKWVFRKNNSFYFTSCEVWDGSECGQGDLSNKDEYERILREYFKGIACVSAETERSTSFLNIPSKVVNHSINWNEYRRIKPILSAEMKFVFFGQYIERKGFDFIFQWLDEHPEAKVSITFFGEGPLKKVIKMKEKNDQRVIEKGKLSQAELKNELYNYNFSLLASKREPFGMSIIEAMAAGVPTLASNVVGPSEIITDGYNGILFKANDYQDFCSKMNEILCMSKEVYENLVNNAIEDAKQYDTHEIVKRWDSLLRGEKNE